MGTLRGAIAPDTIDVRRALAWLRELAANNDRAWYAAHRAVWDEHIKPEWLDTVAGLLATLAARDERYAYVDPRACLFRLARDVRFSKDKTPYTAEVAAWLSPFGKSGTNVGYFVRLEPGNTTIAAGIWSPERPVLLGLREHFASADLRRFDRILAARALAPFGPIETDPLRVAPRGFPKDHPRPELVRARRYILRRRIPDAEIERAGAFAMFDAGIRDLEPFVAYLESAAASSMAIRDLSEG
jgi:uncharacterized protein (TIGR02453 family)